MTDTSWQGKTPDLAPLTVEWFRCAMQPKSQPDGTVLRTLTPPSRGASIGRGLVVLGVLLAVAALATSPIWTGR